MNNEDKEVIEMVNKNNVDRLRQMSVGVKEEVPYKKQKITLKLKLQTTILILLAMAGGIAYGIATTPMPAPSPISHTDEAPVNYNTQEMQRVATIMAEFGLNFEPVVKGSITTPAQYNNDYSILGEQITVDDVYGFFRLFQREGYHTAKAETEKIIQALGYSGWEEFLIHARIKTYGSDEKEYYVGFYDTVTIPGRNIPSIDEFLHFAERAQKCRYDNIDLLGSESGFKV